ncbi:MAG: GntR family transcriptional regulator [Bacteroidetes bacterium]|nr:MAG: GntR family transcriptional regulator [Bacteroidota bacterium]REK00979.1 MAG: GntR family transcriptional regulator [Bacteroidota bacterium]REK34582.1 MAG: GntR family transcriptional regulator [Bacteroidota bacterium]REK51841.1 MAG: GntR family transcriptional regulator [Bacteroidota bacterium]
MIETGKFNKLKIQRPTGIGLFLSDESGEEVLLPNKYCPENYKLGEEIQVFVYRDHADKQIATNLTPKIVLNEFALMKVNQVTNVGAFLDWGLEKELLVPFSEQRQNMIEGRWYIVFMDLDKKTDRPFASNKLDKYLNNESLDVKPGEEVDLLVYGSSGLGYSVIINNKHDGLVYKNETFKKLNIGERLRGFIKKIREENKIDVSIHPIGYINYNDKNCEAIYKSLIENKGFIPLTDDSSAEEIHSRFGISKKAFKKALGALYKQKIISLDKEGIKLN